MAVSRRRFLAQVANAGLATAVVGCSGIRPPDMDGLLRSALGQAQPATAEAPAPRLLHWITPIPSPDRQATPTPVSPMLRNQILGWSEMLVPWQATHPSIVLSPEVVPIESLTERQIAVARGDNPVDVAYTDWGYLLGQAGVVDPLDATSLARKIVPVGLTPHIALDQVYALPIFVSPLGLYLNQQRFRAVGLDPTNLPRDWSSFETAALKLTDRPKSLYGIDVFGSGTPRSGQMRYAPFLWSAGGSFFSDAGDQATWNQTPGLDALIYLARLSQNYASPSSATAEDATLLNNWLTGQTAALLAGPAFTAEADQREISYGVQSIPAYIQGQSSSLVMSAGGVAVFARSKHKDWALDFAHYLAGKDAQVSGLTYLRYLPANVDAADAAPVFQKNPLLARFLRILREDDVHAFPIAASHSTEVEEIFQAYLGVALRGLTTPRVAWNKSAAAATVLLKIPPTPTVAPGTPTGSDAQP
jgi:ABC-type glycerol-3-phosphate transport system substrate-binding protein